MVTKEYYDYYGNLYKKIDGNNQQTIITYDSLQRPIRQVNPDGSVQQTDYDDINNVVTTTDPEGNRKKVIYDSIGRETAVYAAEEDGAFELLTSITYTPHSQPQTKNLYAVGNTVSGNIQYAYYSDGQIKSETIWSNGSELSRTEYDYAPGYSTEQAVNTVKVYQGENDYITVTQYYDLYGRMVKEQVDDGADQKIREFTYDIAGNMLTQTDYNGNQTTYTYDHQNRVTDERDALGEYLTTEYNLFGEVSEVTDRRGNTSTTTYNALGLPIQQIVPIDTSNSGTTKYFYDANGNLTKTYTQNNKLGEEESYRLVQTVYDSMSRPTAVISNDGTVDNVVKYEYDGNGNLTKMATGLTGLNEVINPEIHAVTTYTYNHLNQLVCETDPMGYTATYTYDKLGNLIQKTDKNNVITNYTYDGLGRILRSYAENGTNNVETTYEYDQMSNLTQLHHYSYQSASEDASPVEANNTITYTYDGLGRLLREVNGNAVKEYTYDANGNRKTFKLTNNGIVELNTAYTYDVLNRLTAVTEDGVTTSYTYDDNGNLLTKSGSASVRYTYNKANMPVTQRNARQGTNREIYSITYYADGNKASVTDTFETTYLYDGMGRLKKEVIEDSGETEYVYDNFGNRSQKIQKDAEGNVFSTVIYTYDKNNRLTQSVETTLPEVTTVDYTYDANGNQIRKVTDRAIVLEEEEEEPLPGGELMPLTAIESLPEDAVPVENTEEYTYNLLNQLVKIENSQQNAVYTYNGNGLRESKTVDGVLTNHIYDGQNVVMDVTGSNKQVFHRGLSLISRTLNGTEKQNYVFNTHGDTLQLTNETAGTVLVDYTYDAFGNQETHTENDTNPFRYAGEYTDLCSGLIYLRNRYYDPSIGRFISDDPIRSGTNWYIYANNNPVNYIDPLGLDAIVITNENSVNLGVTSAGHTSAIYQNADGDWFYTYWGNKAAAVIRIPDTYVKEWRRNGDVTANSMNSMSDFNNALNKFLSANGFENITSNYTNATYIVGDFTASLDAAYADVNEAATDNFLGIAKGLTSLVDGSLVFQGTNNAYGLLNANCFDKTYASLSKGTLANGTNVGSYMRSLGFKGGLIPNNAISKFSEVFMNSSFTYNGAYSALSNYASLYAQNSPWAQKASKAAYANVVVGK